MGSANTAQLKIWLNIKFMIRRVVILFLLVTALIVGAFILAYFLKSSGVQHESRFRLDSTVQTGIQLQQVVDEFKKKAGHYPARDDLSGVYSYIGPYNEGISTNVADKISLTQDGSGGWFYNAKTGDLRINIGRKYSLGPQSWVEPNDIDFHSPTKVAMIGPEGTNILDYSWFNNRFKALLPQVDEILTNWIATNKIDAQADEAAKVGRPN